MIIPASFVIIKQAEEGGESGEVKGQSTCYMMGAIDCLFLAARDGGPSERKNLVPHMPRPLLSYSLLTKLEVDILSQTFTLFNRFSGTKANVTLT